MKGRLFLEIAFFLAVVVAADAADTNVVVMTSGAMPGTSVWARFCEFFELHFQTVRGNALWDIDKLFLFSCLKGLVWLGAGVILFISIFSQLLHTLWFCKGFGFLRLPFAKSFADIVSVSQIRRRYLKIDSIGREAVVDGVNSRNGVYLVMGPAGAGKGILLYAESRAKVVLVVHGAEWYDTDETHSPVREILWQRTKLLTQFLLIKKRVCIVLEWEAVHQLPSRDRMTQILESLARFVNGNSRYRKITFVVKVPAYYVLESVRQEKIGEGCRPQSFSVDLLDCSECKRLLERFLAASRWGEKDVAACRKAISLRAKSLSVSEDRLLWVESFGRPRQVMDIACSEHYGSCEAWEALRDWWKRVYPETETKDDWLAYLYVVALKGLVGVNGNHEVDVDAVFRVSGLKFKEHVRPAIGRLCVKQKYDITRFDPMLIFQDDFVRDGFLKSLGELEFDTSDGSEPVVVFSFVNQLRMAIKRSFKSKDRDLCANIAAAYWNVTGQSSNLLDRFVLQYGYVKKLEYVWGAESPVCEAYSAFLFKPATLDAFVAEVISRIGALRTSDLQKMLKGVCEYSRSNMGVEMYVNVVYSLLPAVAISNLLVDLWGVDFPLIAQKLAMPGCSENVRYRCAVILGYAALSSNDPKMFHVRDLGKFHAWAEKQLEMVERHAKCEGRWRELIKMNRVACANDMVAAIRDLDLDEVDSDVCTAWLLRFVHYMQIEGKALLDESEIRALNAICHVVGNAKLEGCHRLLATCCKYLNFISFKLDTGQGEVEWKEQVRVLRLGVNRWTECPTIGRLCFSRLCNAYSVALAGGQPRLVGGDMIWDLVQVVREWRHGMECLDFARVLITFAGLLRDLPELGWSTSVVTIWREFSEIVVGFWLPRIDNGELEDLLMCALYFRLVNRLSNVKLVSVSDRRSLCYAIRPSPCLFQDDVYYNDSAEEVYETSSDVFAPAQKYLMAALLISRQGFESPPSSPNDEIAMAERLIAGARSRADRTVDEGLVEKFRALCGLSMGVDDRIREKGN